MLDAELAGSVAGEEADVGWWGRSLSALWEVGLAENDLLVFLGVGWAEHFLLMSLEVGIAERHLLEFQVVAFWDVGFSWVTGVADSHDRAAKYRLTIVPAIHWPRE